MVTSQKTKGFTLLEPTSLPGITSPMSSLSGFTLIELMVTIAVVAILSTIATSSFKHFVHNNRAKTEIHTFGGDLQSGRSAAIKHGQSVTVCASSNGTQCSGSGPWDTGWIVFLDVDANGSVDAGSDQLLGVHGSIGNGDSMTGNTNTQDTITFNRFGMFSSVAAGDGTVTLHTPDDVVALRRCVVLSTTGKLRFDSGGDCP